MKILPDSDYEAENRPKNLPLPFGSISAEMAGIRVTRAQLAVLLGVSKQSCSEWVKSGRIRLGADGRVDPRQAVAQLLKTGSPTRLRSAVLAPLVQELTQCHQRIAALETDLSNERESLEFQEEASSEYCALFSALQDQIERDWPAIVAAGADALLAWLDYALQYGVAAAGAITDYAAREDEEEGGADDQTADAENGEEANDE